MRRNIATLNRKSLMRLSTILLLLFLALAASGQPYFIAPTGNDQSRDPGQTVRHDAAGATSNTAAVGHCVPAWRHLLLEGNACLRLRGFGAQQSPTVFEAYQDEQPVISGGVRLQRLQWAPHRDGIFKATVPKDLQTEEIFVNGERQILARYPNFDASAQYFDGFAADAISPNRASRWSDPTGGYFHAMHPVSLG